MLLPPFGIDQNAATNTFARKGQIHQSSSNDIKNEMQAYMAQQAMRNPRLRKAQDRFKELPPSIQNSNRNESSLPTSSFQNDPRNDSNVRYSDRVLEQNSPNNQNQSIQKQQSNSMNNGLFVNTNRNDRREETQNMYQYQSPQHIQPQYNPNAYNNDLQLTSPYNNFIQPLQQQFGTMYQQQHQQQIPQDYRNPNEYQFQNNLDNYAQRLRQQLAQIDLNRSDYNPNANMNQMQSNMNYSPVYQQQYPSNQIQQRQQSPSYQQSPSNQRHQQQNDVPYHQPHSSEESSGNKVDNSSKKNQYKNELGMFDDLIEIDKLAQQINEKKLAKEREKQQDRLDDKIQMNNTIWSPPRNNRRDPNSSNYTTPMQSSIHNTPIQNSPYNNINSATDKTPYSSRIQDPSPKDFNSMNQTPTSNSKHRRGLISDGLESQDMSEVNRRKEAQNIIQDALRQQIAYKEDLKRNQENQRKLDEKHDSDKMMKDQQLLKDIFDKETEATKRKEETARLENEKIIAQKRNQFNEPPQQPERITKPRIRRNSPLPDHHQDTYQRPGVQEYQRSISPPLPASQPKSGGFFDKGESVPEFAPKLGSKSPSKVMVDKVRVFKPEETKLNDNNTINILDQLRSIQNDLKMEQIKIQQDIDFEDKLVIPTDTDLSMKRNYSVDYSPVMKVELHEPVLKRVLIPARSREHLTIQRPYIEPNRMYAVEPQVLRDQDIKLAQMRKDALMSTQRREVLQKDESALLSSSQFVSSLDASRIKQGLDEITNSMFSDTMFAKKKYMPDDRQEVVDTSRRSERLNRSETINRMDPVRLSRIDSNKTIDTVRLNRGGSSKTFDLERFDEMNDERLRNLNAYGSR